VDHGPLPPLEGDRRHHSYGFREDDELTPYGCARQCRDVIGMPVLRRSLLGAGGAGPLDRIVPALNMRFELRWTPAEDGECGQCERAGGLCGRRRQAVHGTWAFACFRTAATTAWIASRSPGAQDRFSSCFISRKDFLENCYEMPFSVFK
jgi:hypothetical protein